MIFAASLLLGCQQDLLLLGNVTGLAGAPSAQVPLPVAVATETPAPAEIAPALLDPIPNGGVVGTAAVGATAVAPPPPGQKFNPISVPEGPREGEGVRWEGVKVKGGSQGPIGTRATGRDFAQ